MRIFNQHLIELVLLCADFVRVEGLLCQLLLLFVRNFGFGLCRLHSLPALGSVCEVQGLHFLVELYFEISEFQYGDSGIGAGFNDSAYFRTS